MSELKPLGEWADARTEARFEENHEIARSNRALRSLLKDRDDELETVRKRLGLYEAMEAATIAPPKWLAPKARKGTERLAIPSLLLTDIHWGERVNPDEIDGVNRYDTRISAQRIQRAGEGAIKLCRDYLSGVQYEGLSLMLGGDLLSGEIHDELRETNAESTVESVVGVMEVLIAGVGLLADHFGRVDINCVAGNHGRRTRKPRSKRRSADNYDTLVYRLMARELAGDSRVTIRVAEAADLRFEVYGTKYCLTHGDQFKGGSGISGAIAPLLLGVHRKRRRDAKSGQHWDRLIMGHFHQSIFLSDLIVGGSVIGYNEYAYTSNFVPEDPMAAMWINTPERGVTASMPVHLLDRVAEGW